MGILWLFIGVIGTLGLVLAIIGIILFAARRDPRWKKALIGAGIFSVLIILGLFLRPSGLELVESHIVAGEPTSYIVGTVKNNTNRQYRNVQVVIDLYGASGARIGNAGSVASQIGPGGTWEFKVKIRDEVASYKVKRITTGEMWFVNFWTELSTWFWLLTIASIVLSIYAIIKRSWILMLLSGALFYPLAWYLSATPRFKGGLPLFLLCYILAAVSLKAGNRLIAIIVLIPNFVITSYLAIAVIFQ